ncbi:hypothetical protein AH332_24005, partial [Salmonella enterica subsp. salamae]|nr:hypothetical protein [Salmonella enterica subsp. salamae]EDW4023781.1 hypothetical protein [Salmonella enterica subsp. salamae]
MMINRDEETKWKADRRCFLWNFPGARRATGNSTRRFPRYGGITASVKTWRIFTTTMSTDGWRKRVSARYATAAATYTI